MPPKQPSPPPAQPQRSFAPQAPHYGYGAPDTQHFQQSPSGHYEVLPPPQASQNNGRSGHNPYEFIVNPNAPTRSSASMAGGSFLMRVAVVGVGAVMLIIIAALIMTALKPKSDKQGLIGIAQRQQEIIRVASNTVRQNHANSQDTQNFVANVDMSISSAQQQTISYLATHGTKLKGKTLALDQSTTTDTQLANAITANNFDSAVTQNLLQQLQTYEGLLGTTYHQTSSTTAHAMLQNDYNSADLLIKQGKALLQELGD